MIDSDIQQELQYELVGDEKLIWAGRPRAGIIFTRSDVFYVPFGLIFLGLVSAFFYISYRQQPSSFYNFYIFIFVIAGIYNAFGRFIYDSKRRANTVYGITDARIIIKSGIFSKNYKSVYLEDIPEINIEEGPNSSGTIVLGSNAFQLSDLPGMGKLRAESRPIRLEYLSDVEDPYRLLLKLTNE
jgi:hypothetical protein